MGKVLSFSAAFLIAAVVVTGILAERPGKRGSAFSRIDAAGAQFRQVFLGARLGRNDRKFYIDPAERPAILDSLFPGYGGEALWQDRGLWNNYFIRDYDTKVTSTAFSDDKNYGGVVVYQSFTGCFDIVRRYGADIIILGASDLAQAVPPDVLARSYPNHKILMCAAPTFTLDTAAASLELIAQLYPPNHKRPEYIFVGVSRTMAYLASPFYTALDWTKQELINRYKQADFLGPYAYLNQAYRFPFTWNVLYPVRRDANHLPLVNRISHPERWSILDLQISPEEYQADPTVFDERRRLNKQESSIFLNAENETECKKMQRLPELLQTVNERALKLARRSVIFTTPTMGDELRQAPSCYITMYNREILNLNGERTLALDREMKDYGLNILDFAFRDSRKRGGRLTFDVAHPNLSGAEKFTAFLTQAIGEHFQP